MIPEALSLLPWWVIPALVIGIPVMDWINMGHHR